MRRVFIALTLVVSFAMSTVPALAKPRAKKTAYVGQVIIIGNAITQDRVIREALTDLQPGQILRTRDVVKAKEKLLRLGLFKVDPKAGIRPTVQVLDSPGPFKDILVKVEETPTVSIKPVLFVSPRIGFGVAILEERNFDLARLPTSMADFYEGKAFRGDGQKLHVGIAVGPRVPPRLFFSLEPCWWETGKLSLDFFAIPGQNK